MTTYDIYETTYMGYMPNKDMTEEEVYELVLGNGEWDLVKTYTNEDEAWRMWDGTWSYDAYTEKDADDDILHYCVVVMEKSERNDDEEIIDSCELDYAVKPFIKSQVRIWGE